MALLDIVVTFMVLISLFIIGYCGVTKKTIGEMIQDLREALSRPINTVDIR